MELEKFLTINDCKQLKNMLEYIKTNDIFKYDDKSYDCDCHHDNCEHIELYCKELQEKYPYFDYDWKKGFHWKSLAWVISGFITNKFNFELGDESKFDYPPYIIMGILFRLPFMDDEDNELDENINKVLDELNKIIHTTT